MASLLREENRRAQRKSCLSTSLSRIGFGSLEVACWPLVPKFAGLNPAGTVGSFRAKKKILLSEGK